MSADFTWPPRAAQAEPLRMGREVVDGRLIVRVVGECDITTAPSLREYVLCALAEDGPDMVLDLAQMSFMDSQGLNVFMGVYKQVRAAGGHFVLASVHPRIMRLLRISGLDRIIGSYPGVPEAIGALSRETGRP